MRELKFRQALLKEDGSFVKFHFWGLLGDGLVGRASGYRTGEDQQYTGLKDIYEGDIVTRRNRPDLPCLVYFEEADFSYRLAVRGDKQIDKTYLLRFAGEVIGNIYENPELLKGE